jgi:exonuclease VII small subunit
MSTTCKACGGPVCPYCGGCITCGECSCMYDEIDKATADTKAQLDAANARIADLLAALESSAKMLESVADSYDEQGWDSSSLRENELAQARAAIAKARGEQP